MQGRVLTTGAWVDVLVLVAVAFMLLFPITVVPPPPPPTSKVKESEVIVTACVWLEAVMVPLC